MLASPLTLLDRLRLLSSRSQTLKCRLRDERRLSVPDRRRLQTLERLQTRTTDQIALVRQQLESWHAGGHPDAA